MNELIGMFMYTCFSCGPCAADGVVVHVQPTQSWFMHDGPVDGSCTTDPVIVPVQQTG